MNLRASDRRYALILATLVGAACGKGEPASEPAQPDRTAEVMAVLEANPCDAGSIAALADSTLAALLTGVGHVENEVYDCQRLVMSIGAAGEFGPLVALFPMDATVGFARSAFASPRPAVTVYSWGAAASAGRGDYVGGYPDLGIDPGPHCLWLRNPTDTDTGWKGAIDVILRFPGLYDEAWYQQGPMRRRQAKRIQYAPAPPHQVGAAPWRWQDKGETIWIFCPSGSCHVDL